MYLMTECKKIPVYDVKTDKKFEIVKMLFVFRLNKKLLYGMIFQVGSLYSNEIKILPDWYEIQTLICQRGKIYVNIVQRFMETID